MDLFRSKLKNKLASAMNRVLKFCRLTMKQKLLLISVFFLMGIVRLTILVIPFKYIAPTIGENMADSPHIEHRKNYLKAAKIGWAVDKMSRYTPWESKCLVQAITAQTFLRLFKISYTLYLGLSKDESNKLIAHAWLRCGELFVTGGSVKEGFQTVAQYARFSIDSASEL